MVSGGIGKKILSQNAIKDKTGCANFDLDLISIIFVNF